MTIPKTIPKTVPDNPGRNDPCPCGSGKKYKKCCAMRAWQEKEAAVKATQAAHEAFLAAMTPEERIRYDAAQAVAEAAAKAAAKKAAEEWEEESGCDCCQGHEHHDHDTVYEDGFYED